MDDTNELADREPTPDDIMRERNDALAECGRLLADNERLRAAGYEMEAVLRTVGSLDDFSWRDMEEAIGAWRAALGEETDG